MTQRRMLGNQAEALVCQYLIDDKFSICAQNYLKNYGEIDIIAQKNDLIVFVEVKMRNNPLFDSSYLVNKNKQKKISLVAKAFIAEQAIVDKICRFDVALVTRANDQWHIDYIPNAFHCADE